MREKEEGRGKGREFRVACCGEGSGRSHQQLEMDAVPRPPDKDHRALVSPSLLHDVACIRIVTFPVGRISETAYLKFQSRLQGIHQIDVEQLSAFHQEKSPILQRLNWSEGKIRVKFCNPTDLSLELANFQAHEKVFAAIGIVHCIEHPDLHEAFLEYKRQQFDQLSFFASDQNEAITDAFVQLGPNLNGKFVPPSSLKSRSGGGITLDDVELVGDWSPADLQTAASSRSGAKGPRLRRRSSTGDVHSASLMMEAAVRESKDNRRGIGALEGVVSRCFCFEPLESQEDVDLEGMVMIPELQDRMDFFLNQLIVDVVSSIFFRTESLLSFYSERQLTLTTPLDDVQVSHLTNPMASFLSTSDTSHKSLSSSGGHKFFGGMGSNSRSQKKRAEGRKAKWRADHLLLLADLADSILHYTRARELLRAVHDDLWLAGAIEGLATAVFLKKMEVHEDTLFEECGATGTPVVERICELERGTIQDLLAAFQEALELYKLAGAPRPAIAVLFKIAECHRVMGSPIQAQEALSEAVEIVLCLPEDRIRLQMDTCSTAARYSLLLNMQRKAAHFLQRAAALQHHVGDSFRACVLARFSLPAFGFKMESGGQRMVRKSGWKSLQFRILRKYLSWAEACPDPYLCTHLYGVMLDNFHDMLSADHQIQILSKLRFSSTSIPSHAARIVRPSLLRLVSLKPVRYVPDAQGKRANCF